MHSRIIQQRSRHATDINHVASSGQKAFDHGGMQAVATQPDVAPQRNETGFRWIMAAMAAQISSKSVTKQFDSLAGQIDFSYAANVILAENGGFEHLLLPYQTPVQ